LKNSTASVRGSKTSDPAPSWRIAIADLPKKFYCDAQELQALRYQDDAIQE
jgi:hypothetical protein